MNATPSPHPTEELTERVSGHLPPEVAAEVDAHVAVCQSCQAELTELRAIADALAPEAGAEPRADTLAAIMDRLPPAPAPPQPEAPAPVTPLHPHGPPPEARFGAESTDRAVRRARQRYRRSAAMSLAAAAVVLVMVLGVLVMNRDPGTNGELSGPVAEGAPHEVLLIAADAAEEPYTARLEVDGEVSFGNEDLAVTITGEGELSAPDRLRTEVEVAGSGSLGEMFPTGSQEQLLVDDQLWTRTGGGDWQEAGSVDDPSGSLDGLPDIGVSADVLRQAAEDAEAVGDEGVETVNGEPTRHVRFTVPGELLGVDALFGPDVPATMDVYIAEDGHLRRSEIAVEGESEMLPLPISMYVRVDYVDIGEPVDITAPVQE